MKKIVLGLSFLTLIGFIVNPIIKYFSPEPQEEQAESIPLPNTAKNKVIDVQAKILQKVLPELKEKTKEQKELIEAAFSDYQVNPKDFIKTSKMTKEEAKQYLSKSYQNLKACYKDGCGQEPDEEDGFYDPANTVAVTTMIRLLEVAEANFEDISAKEWLNQDELLELLDSPNGKLRKLSLRSLFKHYPEQAFQKTLNSLKGLEGYQAGDAIEEMIPFLNSENKADFVAMTKQIISEGDIFTITEVLEKSEAAVLPKDDLENIGSDLCTYKREKSLEAAFKAMNYSMSNMGKSSGYNFSLDNYCR